MEDLGLKAPEAVTFPKLHQAHFMLIKRDERLGFYLVILELGILRAALEGYHFFGLGEQRDARSKARRVSS